MDIEKFNFSDGDIICARPKLTRDVWLEMRGCLGVILNKEDVKALALHFGLIETSKPVDTMALSIASQIEGGGHGLKTCTSLGYILTHKNQPEN